LIITTGYGRIRAKENAPLVSANKPRQAAKRRSSPPLKVVPLSEVRCQQQLGGLLKHCYRKAA